MWMNPCNKFPMIPRTRTAMSMAVRLFRRLLDFRWRLRCLKSAVVFIALLFAILFIISSDSVTKKNGSFHDQAFGEEDAALRADYRVLRTSASLPLELCSERGKGAGEERTVPLLIRPLNATDHERIEWVRKNFHVLHMFNSDNFTRKFNVRVEKFFHDNSCAVRFFMTWISPAELIGRRELLVVESLFKSNPDGCLIIISRSLDSEVGRGILKPMVDRGFKVIPASPDLPSVFRRTPAEAWFDKLRSGKVDPGEIPLAQNLSNLIRLAVLYKYGGIYLDTDFIVLRDFSGLRNSIGAQSVDTVSGNWTRINNAVMAFDRRHPLMAMFMREFVATFDGNKWGHNGPYMVSRVVERLRQRGIRGTTATSGFSFTVLPPMAFYPVSWTRIGGLFERPISRRQEKWVEAKVAQLGGGETYGVHLWNKQSRGLRMEEGSVMGRLISSHCVICEGIYGNPSEASPL
ncbi:hypothetical protein SAY87_023889 [Trapa incisa]|uniref:Alpha 1,4-glycosyltransferase domain-containing protein n=1 Tax=Trapa incisa TaxID=236973 RepID=A0AAN7L483_9MYRT|nr:hypothetical protein SAY87_023889 [Trapa incisa]